MDSVTHPNIAFPIRSSTVCIEPPHGLFKLGSREVWAYGELLYFFTWRDVAYPASLFPSLFRWLYGLNP